MADGFDSDEQRRAFFGKLASGTLYARKKRSVSQQAKQHNREYKRTLESAGYTGALPKAPVTKYDVEKSRAEDAKLNPRTGQPWTNTGAAGAAPVTAAMRRSAATELASSYEGTVKVVPKPGGGYRIRYTSGPNKGFSQRVLTAAEVRKYGSRKS